MVSDHRTALEFHGVSVDALHSNNELFSIDEIYRYVHPAS